MNGRVYDPTLGRFLSADPHIQSPYSSQSYNRYSYVSNNPLKYTDPSGYFLGGLFDAIGDIFKGIVNVFKSILSNPVVRIVAIMYGAYALGTAITNSIFVANVTAASGAGTLTTAAVSSMYTSASIIGGAVGGFAGGLLASGGDMSAALVGAFTGGAAGYIGSYGKGLGTELSRTQKAFAHGAVGGVSSKVQGGKFGHGFLSSAFSKYVSGNVHNSKLIGKNPVMGGVAMAMIGGTASALGGGKFSNGARTSTIQFLFNELASDRPELHARIRKKAENGTLITVESMRDDMGEFSRASGYASTASLAVGAVPYSLAAGYASLVSGWISTGLDFYLNGTGMNQTSAAGTTSSTSHFVLQSKVVRLLPAQLKIPANMTMDIIDRVQTEAFYQASKNDSE